MNSLSRIFLSSSNYIITRNITKQILTNQINALNQIYTLTHNKPFLINGSLGEIFENRYIDEFIGLLVVLLYSTPRSHHVKVDRLQLQRTWVNFMPLSTLYTQRARFTHTMHTLDAPFSYLKTWNCTSHLCWHLYPLPHYPKRD